MFKAKAAPAAIKGDQTGVQLAERSGSSFQYEIGVTLGTTETRHLWRIPLPRVGIGYRFGSNLDVIRNVIGTPF